MTGLLPEINRLHWSDPDSRTGARTGRTGGGIGWSGCLGYLELNPLIKLSWLLFTQPEMTNAVIG